MKKKRWILVKQVRGSKVLYYKQARNEKGILERTYLKKGEYERMVKGFVLHTVATETVTKIEFNRGY